MNNNLVWTKTILSVYRYFERICGAIDKLVMQNALSSGYYLSSNDTMSVAQKLIDFSDRKVTLINLKVLTEEILNEIDEYDAKILIKRYFDGMKRQEMADKFDIGLRTVYRKLQHAEQAFASKLVMKGFSDSYLESYLEKEHWILQAKNRIVDKGEDEFELVGISIKKAASL